ncbi:hypothetical protein TI05_01930 [Achromatium sp. WMS3]|nr:hypothetical protein TI05_01930 [Achromatium sp. WMS3]
MRPNIWQNSFGLHSFSIAGDANFYLFKALNLLIDIGAWHPILASAQHIFLSHGHMDHIAGLFKLLSYKTSHKIQPPTIYAHPDMQPNIQTVCQALEQLNGLKTWDYHWQNLIPETHFTIGNNRLLQAFPLTHHIHSNACLIWEQRKRLQERYKGLDTQQIQRLVLEGAEVNDQILIPIIFYSGDTESSVFAIPELFNAEICVLECTFWEPEYRSKANKFKHLHIMDILDVASQFNNKTLILTHISERYSIEFITNTAQKLQDLLPRSVQLKLDLPTIITT